ncbi:MAG: alanine racemase [Treponema sp.]|nr:alanine racemase [Treponema sp.]
MRTSAIIHLGRFLGNLRAIRERVGTNCRICVPVKADGYGHGALEIARAGLEAGAFCLGVAAVAEGAELRNGGIKAPVLLFSQPDYREIPDVIKTALTPFVSDTDYAGALNREASSAGIRLPVHLKIDTGMGRLGCRAEDALDIARFIAECPALEYAGTATHLAVSDSTVPADIEYTGKQIALFREAVDRIRSAGIDTGIVHAANSGAVVLHPDAWFDMVRPGILLYGYNLADEKLMPDIKPVMELRSIAALIKKVKKGESFSYGRTWTAPHDTNAAVLPAGYADGLPRLASNRWQVVINGNTYPLAGRICMDQCLVDLGPEAAVKRGDEAVIFGGPAPDAAALAEITGTIPYEITCNINKRVPRVYED